MPPDQHLCPWTTNTCPLTPPHFVLSQQKYKLEMNWGIFLGFIPCNIKYGLGSSDLGVFCFGPWFLVTPELKGSQNQVEMEQGSLPVETRLWNPVSDSPCFPQVGYFYGLLFIYILLHMRPSGAEKASQPLMHLLHKHGDLILGPCHPWQKRGMRIWVYNPRNIPRPCPPANLINGGALERARDPVSIKNKMEDWSVSGVLSRSREVWGSDTQNAWKAWQAWHHL